MRTASAACVGASGTMRVGEIFTSWIPSVAGSVMFAPLCVQYNNNTQHEHDDAHVQYPHPIARAYLRISELNERHTGHYPHAAAQGNTEQALGAQSSG